MTEAELYKELRRYVIYRDNGKRFMMIKIGEIQIKEERISAEEYIEFLKRTDLGSQYPRERFEERIKKLVNTGNSERHKQKPPYLFPLHHTSPLKNKCRYVYNIS